MKLPSARITRRQWIGVSTALAGGYWVSSGPLLAEELDPNDLDMRRHACVDVPTILPTMTYDEMAAISPVEVVIADQEGKVEEGFAAAAPQYGPGLVAAGAPSTQPARAAYENSWKIADKRVRIAFANGIRALQDGVMDIAREWCKYADLTFDRVPPNGNPHVLINFNRGLGHKSYIGPLSKNEVDRGRPSMNLGFLDQTTFDLEDRYSHFVILHEFGHALGCIHEHQQPGSEARFKETDPKVLSYWRQALRTNDNGVIHFNVFRRWNNHNLIKYSNYDARSIMHYAFPAWMFVDGKERVQNFELSHLDKAFAAIVYPTPDGPKYRLDQEPPKPGINTTSTPVLTSELVIDGQPVQFRLTPGQGVALRIKVAAGQGGKPYTIYSEGSTQVVLQLLGPNDAAKDATPLDGHGTYDLTNDVIRATLAEGEYVVKAQHVSARGGGPLAVAIRSSDIFQRLLAPNRLGQ